MKKILFLAILLFCVFDSAQAQLFRSSKDTGNVVWKIRFSPDYGLQTLAKSENYGYKGEYFTGGQTGTWIWRGYDSTTVMNKNTDKINTMAMTISLNMYKNAWLGFSYHPTIVREDYIAYSWGGGGYQNQYFLFGLSANAGYDFVLPFANRRFSIQPTAYYGGYQSFGNRLYEYIGKETYWGIRPVLAFRPFKQNEFRVWMNYQQFNYNENRPSSVFPDKNREVYRNVSTLSWGIGYNFNITIKEDYERKSKKKKKKEKE